MTHFRNLAAIFVLAAAVSLPAPANAASMSDLIAQLKDIQAQLFHMKGEVLGVTSTSLSTTPVLPTEKLTITVPQNVGQRFEATITGPAALMRDIYDRQSDITGGYSFGFLAHPLSPDANKEMSKYGLYMSGVNDMTSPTGTLTADVSFHVAGYYQQIPITPGKYQLEVRASKPMTKTQYGHTDFKVVASGLSNIFTFGSGTTDKPTPKGSCTIKVSKERVGENERFKVTWKTKGIKDPVLYEGIKAGGYVDVKKKGKKTYQEPSGAYQFAIGTGEGSNFQALCRTSILVMNTYTPSKRPTATTTPTTSGKVIRAHVYEAKGSDHNFCYSKPGTVRVDVPKQSSPVTLSLAAYEPVIWEVHPADDGDIKNVVLGGYNPQKVTGLPKSVPIEERTFYSLSRTTSAGSNPGQGVFVDSRNPSTIYHWAGHAMCEKTSGSIPLEYRTYLSGKSGYEEANYGSNYSAETMTAR